MRSGRRFGSIYGCCRRLNGLKLRAAVEAKRKEAGRDMDGGLDRMSREGHVRVGGGVSTIRQYLRAGLIDERHLAIRPVLLGSGEHLLKDIDVRSLGYECAKYVAGERATHVFLRKRPAMRGRSAAEVSARLWILGLARGWIVLTLVMNLPRERRYRQGRPVSTASWPPTFP